MTESIVSDPHNSAIEALVDPSEAALQAAGALLNMSDEAWDAHQEARYPGTQEIIEARRGMLRNIGEFVAPDAPAARLFNRFEPRLREVTDPTLRLAVYEALGTKYLDYRKGAERQQENVTRVLKAPREEVGEELWDLAFDVCGEIGIVGNTELREEGGRMPTRVGVLGATESAVHNRTRYGHEQVVKHDADIESFDFLIAEHEIGFAKDAARAHLGADVDKEVTRVERPDGIVTTYAPVTIGGRQIPVRILTAKATKGRDRATTYDTMRLWRDVSDLKSGDLLAAVSTDIYTGFQEANAREIITWNTGTFIRVFGHSGEWAGNPRFARQLLQELKAKVDSDYCLYKRMVAVGMAPPLPEITYS
jgi:hypothetical protein